MFCSMGKQSRRKNRQERREAEAAAEAAPRRPGAAMIIFVLGLVGGIAAWYVKDWEWGVSIMLVGLIAAGAYDSFFDPPDSRPGGSSDAINFGN